MAAQPSPRREVVTGVPRGSRGAPGTTRPPSGPARPAPRDEQARRLMRAQWRTTLAAAGALALPLGALPLLLAATPLGRLRIGGVGVAWPLLGVLVYPLLYAVGHWYVTRAEAHEARHTAGTGRPGTRR